MSYRTEINDVQIFGNNECYPQWIEFIKAQGIDVDEDGCYSGEITDVMGALSTIEDIIVQMESERKEHITDTQKRFLKNNAERPFGECIDEYNRLFNKTPMNRHIWDFSTTYDLFEKEKDCDIEYRMSLTDCFQEIYEDAYLFMNFAFLRACEDDIEHAESGSVPGHFRCYKVKEGHTIKVRAS